ncbi:alpha/beta hydrolase [Cecembia sp.]|uniref:alpha/beta hydrolase n=1 Tax=Cecembia sp. TaxID=1898110 RepID=UPI0025C079F6|nr:alpha/beta hydrolase [Cecembia sp.]
MKNAIRYEHQAHFRISHLVNRNENEILFALHGYGQLSEYFLKKMKPLFQEERLIVVPEATNHAYLEGFSGRVGANWMTKHEREAAIQNNNKYLNAILDSILVKYNYRPTLKVLGFSQGAATATRWVSQLTMPVDTLILWGGGFAHDLNPEKFGSKLKQSKCFIALGEQDGMITEESLLKQEELINSLSIKAEKVRYPGGHDLDTELLSRLLNI